MEALERAVLDRLSELDPEGVAPDRETPLRAYALYEDHLPAPAVYLEAEVDGREVPVVVHNLRYYEYAMHRWRIGFVEALVLNELHELTHWAMTEEERADLDARSVERGVPDGHVLNGPLLWIVDWLDVTDDRMLDAGLLGLRPFRRRVAWTLRGALPGVEPE